MSLPSDSNFVEWNLGLEADRASFVAAVLKLGLPFAVLTLILIVAAAWLHTGPGRLWQAFYLLTKCSCRSPRTAVYFSAFWILIAIAAAALLLAFGITVLVKTRPLFVGIAILTLIPSFLLILAVGWRFSATKKLTLLLSFLLMVALALFTTFEFSVVFLPEVYSYLATTWLFVTLNCLFVLLAVHTLLGPSSSLLSIRLLIAAALQWRRFRLRLPPPSAAAAVPSPSSVATGAGAGAGFEYSNPLRSGGGGVGGHAAGSTVDSGGKPSVSLLQHFLLSSSDESLLTQEAEKRLAIAETGDTDDDPTEMALALRDPPTAPSGIAALFSRCNCFSRVSRKTGQAVCWYFVSLLVLGAYIAVNFALGKSVKYLSLPTVATVLLIDATALLLYGAGLIPSSPGGVYLLLCVARIALIAYGTQYWLLGQATVYALIGLYLASTTTQQYYNSRRDDDADGNEAGEDDADGDGIDDALEGDAAMTASPGAPGPSTIPAASSRSFLGCCKRSSGARVVNRRSAVVLALLSPLGILCVITGCFVILVGLLWHFMSQPSSTLPNVSVPTLTGGNAPQIAFPIGAACLVVLWLSFSFLFGHYKKNGLRLTTITMGPAARVFGPCFRRVPVPLRIFFGGAGGWSLALLCWALSVGAGVGLWIVTQIWTLLLLGIFLPLFLISVACLYGSLVKHDFSFFLPGGLPHYRNLWRETKKLFGCCACSKRQPSTAASSPPLPSSSTSAHLATTSANNRIEPTQIRVGGTEASSSTPEAVAVAVPVPSSSSGPATESASVAQPASPSAQSPAIFANQWSNLYVCLGILVALGSLVGFGASYDAAVSRDPVNSLFPWAGWVAAGCAAVLLLTIAPIVHYFQTLTFDWFQPLSLIGALLLLVAIHGFLFYKFSGSTAAIVGIAFSIGAYPFLALLLTALYKLWDDGWKRSKFSTVCLALSQTIVVGIIVASIIYWRATPMIPAALLVAYCLASFAVAASISYISSGYYLSKRWVIASYALVSLIVAAGVVLAAWETLRTGGSATNAVLWFSVSWWIIILALAATGLGQIYSSGGFRSGLIAASPSAAAGGSSFISTVNSGSSSGGTAASAGSLSVAVPIASTGGEGAVAVRVPSTSASNSPGASRPTRVLDPLTMAVLPLDPLPAPGQHTSSAGAAGARLGAGAGASMVGAAAVPVPSSSSSSSLYYSCPSDGAGALFPVYGFNRTRDALLPANSGPLLLLAAFFLAFLWAVCAMVFVAPAWAGVMVTNVLKMLLFVYILDSLRQTSLATAQSWRVLIESGAKEAVNKAVIAAASTTSSSSAAVSTGTLAITATGNGVLVAELFAGLSPAVKSAASGHSWRSYSSSTPGLAASTPDGSVAVSGSGGGVNPFFHAGLSFLPSEAQAISICRSFLLDAICTELELALREVRVVSFSPKAGDRGFGAAQLFQKAGAGASALSSAVAKGLGSLLPGRKNSVTDSASGGAAGTGVATDSATTSRRPSAPSAPAVSETGQPSSAAFHVSSATAGAVVPQLLRDAMLPPAAFSFVSMFSEATITRRRQAVKSVAESTLLGSFRSWRDWLPPIRGAFDSCKRSGSGGAQASAAPGSATAPAVSERVTALSNAISASEALLVDRDKRDATLLNGWKEALNAFGVAEDLKAALSNSAAATGSGPSLPATIEAQLVLLYQHIDALTQLSTSSSDEAFLLVAHLRHGLSRQGKAAEAQEAASWQALLSWCASPHAADLLVSLGIADLCAYFSILVEGKTKQRIKQEASDARRRRKAALSRAASPIGATAGAGAVPVPVPSVASASASASPALTLEPLAFMRFALPPASALRSRDSLVHFWLSSLGPAKTSILVSALACVENAFAEASRAAALEMARRRAEDEAAEAARRQAEAERLEAERQRHIQEEVERLQRDGGGGGAASSGGSGAINIAAAATAAASLRALAVAERERKEREERMRHEMEELQAALAEAARQEALDRARAQAEAALRAEQERMQRDEHERAQRQAEEAAAVAAAIAAAAEEAEAQRRAQEDADAKAAQFLALQQEQDRQKEVQRLKEEEEARARAEAARRQEEMLRRQEELRLQQIAEAEARAREAMERERLSREREQRAEAERALQERLALEEAKRRAEAERAAREAAQAAAQAAAAAQAQAQGQRVLPGIAAAAAAATATVVDSHKARVLAQVQQLSSASGGAFTDREFTGPKAASSAGAKAAADSGAILSAKAPWVRMQDFHPNPVIVDEDGYRADDVQQGALGDCYFLAALSIAGAAGFLNQLVLTTDVNPCGVYACRFWRNGEGWKEVLVDNMFPAKAGSYFDASESADWPEKTLWAGEPNPPRGKYAAPLYASSRTKREFWIALLEKAYAKLYGSFAAIEGGLVSSALADMIPNSSSSVLTMTTPEVKAQIRDGSLFEKLKTYHQSGFLLGAGSPAGSDRDVSASGIVQGHAYSILRVDEVSDARGTVRLLKLRNPWGSGAEWNGRFSDSDTASWSKRLRQLLRYDPEKGDLNEDGTPVIPPSSASGGRKGRGGGGGGGKKGGGREDGVFHICFEDFASAFEDIYVTRLFKTVSSLGSSASSSYASSSSSAVLWNDYSVVGEWTRETAGGCPNFDTVIKNPQFYLKASRPTNIFISLSARVSAKHPAGSVCLGAQLLRKGGKRAKCVYAGQSVLKTGYCYTEATAEGKITPEDQPLTLIVSTFDPGVEVGFTLRIYADQPLEMIDPPQPDAIAAGLGGQGTLRRIPESAGVA